MTPVIGALGKSRSIVAHSTTIRYFRIKRKKKQNGGEMLNCASVDFFALIHLTWHRANEWNERLTHDWNT